MLLLVTGSSCSGKSTAARGCSEVGNLELHDSDERGVPSHADKAWRQRTLEQWVSRAVELQDSADLLLTTQSPIGEVLSVPSAPHLEAIAVCLLDVGDDERRRRLESRDPDRWSTDEIADFVGWAEWHRRHAMDPRHQPEVLMTGCWNRMRWDRWVSWPSDDPRWRVSVIDTSGQSEESTSTELRSWVSQARRELPSPLGTRS